MEGTYKSCQGQIRRIKKVKRLVNPKQSKYSLLFILRVSGAERLIVNLMTIMGWLETISLNY
jgi:hypothetical protein